MREKIFILIISLFLFTGCNFSTPRVIKLGEVFVLTKGQRAHIVDAAMQITFVDYSLGQECPPDIFCLTDVPPSYTIRANDTEYQLLGSQIISINDVRIQSLQDGTTAKENLRLTVYKKDNCLAIESDKAKKDCIVEKQDPMMCLNISDNAYRKQCIGSLILANRMQPNQTIDIDMVCAGFDPNKRIQVNECKDVYYQSLAVVKNSLTVCDQLSSPYHQYNCYTDHAIRNSDASVCAHIPDDAVTKTRRSSYPTRDGCYTHFSRAKKEKKWCELIVDQKIKEGCLQ